MKTLEERLFDDANKEIEKNEIRKQVLPLLHVNLWKEAFPMGSFNWNWGVELNVTLPMSYSIIQEVKEFAALQFPEWKLYNERQYVWEESNKAGIFMEYRLPNAVFEYYYSTLSFSFRSEVKESTCVLKKIGTKQVEVPVLEIVCTEGAEEEW